MFNIVVRSISGSYYDNGDDHFNQSGFAIIKPTTVAPLTFSKNRILVINNNYWRILS